jgi:Amt family ammonium transporter
VPIAALVAITAACAFVAPWAAIVIGLRRRGVIVVSGVLLVERAPHRRPDRRDLGARHGRSLGERSRSGFLALPGQAEEPRDRATAASLRRRSSTSSAYSRSACCTSGPSPFAGLVRRLWLMKVTFGIRTEPEDETAGLDVSEHGMWGYPEFYIPVPGGYGTESHGHLGIKHAHPAPAATATAAVPLPEPS